MKSKEKTGDTVFVAVLVTIGLLVALPGAAFGNGQRPFRGSVPISVLLCKYADAASPVHTREYFENMFINRGTSGLADYWNAVSFGSINLAGSTVRGWYGLRMTVEEARALSAPPKRIQLHSDCVDRVKRFYDPPDNHIVVVITSPGITGYGMPGRVFLDEEATLGAFIHEVGHGLYLHHSFSNSAEFRSAYWSSIGEYDDPWDVMSFANVYSPDTPFGLGAPGLNAYQRDRMGWLDRNKILRFGADGVAEKYVTLTALNYPEGDGYQMIRVPFDPADPYHYYTVEYRVAEGWDSGLPSDRVLIHEVAYKSFEPAKPGKKGYWSFLIRDNRRGVEPLGNGTEIDPRPPSMSLSENGVLIQVATTDPARRTATVRIRAPIVQHCIRGLVWREATPEDRACVSGSRRAQVREENASAAARRQPGGGAYGPDTCRSGFVWRDAIPGDRVCVTRESSDLVQRENQDAGENSIGGAAYGPNTCKRGYVWREADARDWVCVSRERHAQVQAENANALAHRQPGGGAYGPETCRSDFVWRDAFPGDHVCVSRESRNKVREENASASSRLAREDA
jgi:hypothetical protein